QGLVNNWIEKRISRSGMIPKEVKAIRKQLALMRDEGEKALKEMQEGKMGEELQKNYEGWKECPICQGVSPMNID
ncbi:MAG TPA: hypothetical protein DDW68_12295, partial [Verrucomicrobiales bacterium]|nr:hypothetical protein [Verrucomicrobiales bacterium]